MNGSPISGRGDIPRIAQPPTEIDAAAWTAAAAGDATATTPSIRRILLASFIGTTIEWYDFFIYGTAAALVFNRLFFPSVNPFLGTLASFATFTVGFVARPFGAVVFGHFGDRLGRKSMLIYSLLIMGIATFLIGMLPTYETAGMWAPIILVLMRVAQGIGIGGEWGGAVLLAIEHSAPGKRGFAGSWPEMGGSAGLLLSTLVFAVVTGNLTDEQFAAWGWRLPFLLSVVLIGVGLWIRLHVPETPAFAKVKARRVELERPIVGVVRDYGKNLLLAMGMRIAQNALFYIVTVFVLSYAQSKLNISRSTVLTGETISAAIGLFAVPFFGALSDRVGRKTVYLSGALFAFCYALPFFWLLNTQSTLVIWLAIILGMNLGHDCMHGPQAAYFSELFGTQVRYSGISVAYQLTSILGGGLAPLISFALLETWGYPTVAAYVMTLCAITATATFIAPETYRRDLDDIQMNRASIDVARP